MFDMIDQQYFEDYEVGVQRETFGRTITETDFVVHAGHSGPLLRTHLSGSDA